ncbi:ketoisovalerate oxidoreductase [bacterium (Candidatus Howlettbacteria) CG_4_10_14_0_8_um_filter_40_9]|nr:MAG: ketoisovalerate oxidoreductase [bacterium (Candidatus Howlettbacteria) CG_4_10_14_0_8_um_filter_40_9]
MDKPTRIIFSGEGGQGVQTIAEIMARAGHLSGHRSTYLPNYGVEQRGGVSIAFVQLCGCPEEATSCSCNIGFPKFKKADVMVVLCERAIERTRRYVKKEALYIYDNSLISNALLAGISCPKIALPATEIAKKKLTPRVFNVVLLGAVIAYTGVIDKKYIIKAIEEQFAEKIKKNPEIKHLNRRAFDIGYEVMSDIIRNAKKERVSV